MSDQHVSIAGGSVVVGKPNDGVQPVSNGEQAVPNGEQPKMQGAVPSEPTNTLEQGKEVPPEPTKDGEETKLYQPQEGDTDEDIIIGMLTESTGVTEEHITDAILNALKYSDSNLIDYNKLYQDANITDDAKRNQVKLVVDNLYKKASAQQKIIEQTAYDMAGGKDKYTEALKAFQDNASPALYLQVSALANAGYLKESVQLMLDTVRNTGLVSHTTSPILQAVAAQQQPKQVDVQQGIKDLINKYGPNFLSNREARTQYEQLTKHN